MAKKKAFKKRLTNKDLEPVPRNCPFDKNGTAPDYKDIELLQKYVSDRAKILGKDRTGICAKHQRMMSVAIKRARHLGLLPYTPSLK
ncbi:MAG TPA: 30S ribosomal protein S18 [Patescibacteria group bacterium]|nr:30S ribosomal protein S18 [Patescibacteria group bacterium]